MASLIIKNARVVDPGEGIDKTCDVEISNGIIARVGKSSGKGKETFDARGMLLLPGLVDMHVHARVPGLEHKETIASVSAAAAAGGVCVIACMANTNPPVDSDIILSGVLKTAAKTGNVRFYQIGAVTKGLEGKELSEMGMMAKSGAVAFSDDGQPIASARMMAQALQYSSKFGKVIIVHAEDRSLTEGRPIADSETAFEMGIIGQSPVSEEISVSRDIKLCKEFGGRVHFAHVSTSGALDEIRRAKKDSVSAEATPHHLFLNCSRVKTHPSFSKMNPPLRAEEDRQALVRAVVEDVVDVIATDHAPHSYDEKEENIQDAPFGVTGLETSFSACYTFLVAKKILTLDRLLQKTVTNPARILGVNPPAVREGNVAELFLFDPAAEWKVAPRASKSVHNAFYGMTLVGKTVLTFANGKEVFRR